MVLVEDTAGIAVLVGAGVAEWAACVGAALGERGIEGRGLDGGIPVQADVLLGDVAGDSKDGGAVLSGRAAESG